MQTNHRICFDANVLITAALGRTGKNAADKALHRAAGRACTSVFSTHLLVYFGQKSLAAHVLKQFRDEFVILSLDSTDVSWAFANCKGQDFEDALQLAAAVRHGCDEFVTFDKNLHKNYRSLTQTRVRLIS